MSQLGVRHNMCLTSCGPQQVVIIWCSGLMVFHWSAGAEHGGGRYNPRGPVSWRGGSGGLTKACGYLLFMVLSHRAISKLAFWDCALTPSKRQACMDLLIIEPISIAVINQERG